MVQEKLVFDERFKELVYENTIMQKKVDALHGQMREFEQEAQILRDDRNNFNQNSNQLATKLKILQTDFVDIRSENEHLKHENIRLRENLERVSRRTSYNPVL